MLQVCWFLINNTPLNKSQAWYIDGSTSKNPYNFYEVLTFKWHAKKIEPNSIISLQISYLSEATVSNLHFLF